MQLDTMTLWLLSSRHYADSLWGWCIYFSTSFLCASLHLPQRLVHATFTFLVSLSKSPQPTDRKQKELEEEKEKRRRRRRGEKEEWERVGKTKRVRERKVRNPLPAHRTGMRDTSEIPQVAPEDERTVHSSCTDVLFAHYHCLLDSCLSNDSSR